MKDLQYCKVGGPPDDWHNIEIWLNGKLSQGDWTEVNSGESWGIRYARNESEEFFLDGEHVAFERITGDFQIRRRAP